jgi:hypothetical protein
MRAASQNVKRSLISLVYAISRAALALILLVLVAVQASAMELVVTPPTQIRVLQDNRSGTVVKIRIPPPQFGFFL